MPGHNDDYDLSVWAAAVYVLQHYDDGPAESEFSPAVLQLALSLAGNTRSAALYEAIMKVSSRSPGSRQVMEGADATAILVWTILPFWPILAILV